MSLVLGGVGVWDVLVLLEGMAGRVVVDLRCPYVFVVMLWAVFVFCGVDVRVHLRADSEGVKVVEVEEFEFLHQGFLVCSRWEVFDNSD